MLGRGLESLIPPEDDKGNTPLLPDANVHGAPPPSTSSAPVVPPLSGLEPPLEPRGENNPSRQPHSRRESSSSIFHIEVEKIAPNPAQPRRIFEEQGIEELAASIREFGLLQPIVVSKVEKEIPTGTEVSYELISGERRFLAVKRLGLERIPAIIRAVDAERERLEIALIENIQREDLNSIELARAFSRLQDEFRLTQREIAQRVGKSREVVANTMRLLDLPSTIQEAVEKRKISESHGRLLLTVDNPALQEKLFQDLLGGQFTTRELKNRARALERKPEEKPEEKVGELSPELKMFEEKLRAELGAPVKILRRSEGEGGTGKITITFYSDEELRHIVERFAKDAGDTR